MRKMPSTAVRLFFAFLLGLVPFGLISQLELMRLSFSPGCTFASSCPARETTEKCGNSGAQRNPLPSKRLPCLATACFLSTMQSTPAHSPMSFQQHPPKLCSSSFKRPQIDQHTHVHGPALSHLRNIHLSERLKVARASPSAPAEPSQRNL